MEEESVLKMVKKSGRGKFSKFLVFLTISNYHWLFHYVFHSDNYLSKIWTFFPSNGRYFYSFQNFNVSGIFWKKITDVVMNRFFKIQWIYEYVTVRNSLFSTYIMYLIYKTNISYIDDLLTLH